MMIVHEVALEWAGMKNVLGGLTVMILTVTATLSPARADLNFDVRQVLQDKLLARADCGIALERLGNDADHSTPVFRHESDQPLVPASNLKLITTSAALDRLGPDFKFKTCLVKRGDDIVIVGDGDPTFGDATLLKQFHWTSTTVFEKWAKQLKDANISAVHNVLVDDSIFDQNFVHPDWPVKQAHLPYVAGVAGLNLNANCLDFYLKVGAAGQLVGYVTDPPPGQLQIQNDCVAGRDNAVWLTRDPGSAAIILKGQVDQDNIEPISVTVQDPPMFAAGVFAEMLKREGIKWTGAINRDRTVRQAMRAAATQPSASDTPVILSIHDTPIASAIARANKDSMNLYAEALCKRLGAATTGESGTWENGLAAIKTFLTAVGVDASQYNLDDGCGLSHKNTISAAAIVKVLTYDYFSRNHQAFMDSMGIAGVDGRYLQSRFANTDLKGRVLLKSGFVNNVSGISGYLHAKDGQWYVFSILMNGIPDGSNSTAKQLQERIVKALDNSTVGINAASANAATLER